MVRKKVDVPRRISIMIAADVLEEVDQWKEQIEDVSRSELITKLVRFALERQAVDQLYPDILNTPRVSSRDLSISLSGSRPREEPATPAAPGPLPTPSKATKSSPRALLPQTGDRRDTRSLAGPAATAEPVERPLLVGGNGLDQLEGEVGSDAVPVGSMPRHRPPRSSWPASTRGRGGTAVEGIRKGPPVLNPEDLMERVYALQKRVQRL